MMIQSLLHTNESYTHKKWIYRDVCVEFSRLYYIIDGEAYYEEEGKAVRFQKNHLYLTPVKKPFTLYENSEDKLLHTYAHIMTLPAITEFTEIPVEEGTPMSDAVALWRKYVHTNDILLLTHILQFLLSCTDQKVIPTNTVAEQAKAYINGLETFLLNMESLSHALGYSREHITRSFFSAYHMTPKQYFNQRRMNAALEQLLAGARVFEVSDRLHFSSPYSFSKAFKHYFGLSPENYLLTLGTESTAAPKRYTKA